MTIQEINQAIKLTGSGLVSDGYHTFDELYEHRNTLWIELCKLLDRMHSVPGYREVWRTNVHSDNSSIAGWFLLGFRTWYGGQITYHLPISKWEECNFAETLDKAPDFDGHTSQDVLERLKQL